MLIATNFMANPSLKNGYISVATELVEVFSRTNIPGGEMRMIWTLWRKTWGWKDGERKKDWDWISYSQFERATGMTHRSVGKYLKSLVAKRLLLKGEKGYRFNQNYNEWVVAKRLLVAKQVKGSSQKATFTGSQKATHNRYSLKETNTTDTPPEKITGEIADLFRSFRFVNGAWETWWENAKEIKAARNLLKVRSKSDLEKVFLVLKDTNRLQYMPKITCPSDLEEKWEKWFIQLEQYWKEMKSPPKARQKTGRGLEL